MYVLNDANELGTAIFKLLKLFVCFVVAVVRSSCFREIIFCIFLYYYINIPCNRCHRTCIVFYPGTSYSKNQEQEVAGGLGMVDGDKFLSHIQMFHSERMSQGLQT